jgi:hypothetical protein
MSNKIPYKNGLQKNLKDKKLQNNQADLIALMAVFEAARSGDSGLQLAFAAKEIKNLFNASKSTN